MSDVLEHAKHIQSLKESSSSSTLPSGCVKTGIDAPTDVTSGNASSTSPDDASLRSSDTKETTTKASSQMAKSTSSSTGGFGGMKKGFLIGGPSKKHTSHGKSLASSSKSVPAADLKPVGGEEIPLIRPKEGSRDAREQYRIDEVQEALKTTAPLLQNKEWITEDLLSNLEKHPRLARQLTDPRFAQAVSKFQRNPQQAMEEYKGNAEVQQFFRDFCALLGNHFSTMGGASPPSVPSSAPPPQDTIRTPNQSSRADIKVKSSTNPKQATAADETEIRQILADPEIREILMDQKMQRLIETLRTNPDQGQGIIHSAGPEMQAKIHKLVNAGLLGFAP
ncbi:serine/arginine repetitive matrix protein 2-like isoform X2 [Acanthaster planci]|nr:serine/arginine repetitive matrix protein 2-like isoform X2 [Acanthaster planci]